MRAILSTAPGGPETLVLQDIPEPIPGPGEVLMSVKAAGANFFDTLIIEDKYQYKPERPFSPGGEASGVVKAVGAGVTHVQPGDRVVGHTLYGTMCEAFVLDAAAVYKIPDSLPFEVAAGLVTTYASAYYALKNRAALKPGENLLVLGAAGGMGVAAIELGKAMGARVIAAVSTEEKKAFALSKGADSGLVYPAGPTLTRNEQRAFADAIKAETGGAGVDVVYDPVGGDYAEPAIRATAWEGRFLTLGYPAGIPRIPLNLCLLKNIQIVGVAAGAFFKRDPEGSAENIHQLIDFCSAGKIRPHIQAVYPLEKTGEALRALADRKAQGKIIISME